MLLQSFFLIKALLKPLSMKDCETAINTVSIPIRPNSLRESNLARIIPTIKVIPCPAIVSTKLQISPLTVFCLSDDILTYLRTYPRNTSDTPHWLHYSTMTCYRDTILRSFLFLPQTEVKAPTPTRSLFL